MRAVLAAVLLVASVRLGGAIDLSRSRIFVGNAAREQPTKVITKSLRANCTIQDRPPGATEVSHKSWFEKMKDAFWSVIIGIALMSFSIPVLWVNERNAARQESLIAKGEQECVEVSADERAEERRGTIVRVANAHAEGQACVQDDRFQCFAMGPDQKLGPCLRLQSTVEAYQWVEHSKTTEHKDRVGGGTTKTTTYNYEKEWVKGVVDSSNFHDKTVGTNCLAKPGFTLGMQQRSCENVRLGKAFTLPVGLVAQLSSFRDANKLVGDAADDFRLGSDGSYYFFPEIAGARANAPEIGDMRARLEFVEEQKVTVIALQAKSVDDTGCDTFLPYRAISHGLCGVTEEVRKERRLREAQKNANELYAADKCSCGPLDCVLCCCVGMINCVSFIFAGILTPEIYHLYAGAPTAEECWANIKSTANAKKWSLRLVGWLMLLIGIMAVFQPLFVVFDIVPFFGPMLSNFLWVLVFVVALFTTFAVASIVIAVAYLIYRPLIGLLYLSLTMAIVIGFSVLVRMSRASGK